MAALPPIGRATAVAFGCALVCAPALPSAAATPPARQPSIRQPSTQPTPTTTSPESARKQAALVDQEDQRIMQTRSVLSAILQIGGTATPQWKRPQSFGSAHGRTLVLPAPSDNRAYTVADLAKVGGKYFKKLPDGSYLLAAHLFVADGAKLVLDGGDEGLTLRLGSGPGAFASIVSFGGTIKINGTARRPVKIMSWNVGEKAPDKTVDDGRAYIRAVGGEFRMKHAEVSDLGFWSGRTGGIALTGTDRPASAFRRFNKEQRHANKRKRLENKDRGAGGGPGDIEIEAPDGTTPGGTATHVPAADLVTASIEDSTVTGDAFGLFVSGANQAQIKGNRISGSLVHGVLMHRFAKNATIENTTVTGSGGDGFVLSRATEKVRVTGCTAERNGRNGFTLNGSPLAIGPSASGESLESFGESTVSNSVARDNGHYGIEILGGHRLAVHNSKVSGGDMGIVVRAGAAQVQISGNQLTGQVRQGIALRDGVRGANLAGNTVTGARTGVYLRDSNGTLVGNVIQGANAHAITFVGNGDGSQVTGNTLGGSGTSAVSTSRADGRIVKRDNDTDGWTDTASVWAKAQRYAKPMNMVWFFVLLLVILSAARARGARGPRSGRTAPGGVLPYAPQRALERKPVWTLPRAEFHGPLPNEVNGSNGSNGSHGANGAPSNGKAANGKPGKRPGGKDPEPVTSERGGS